MSIFKEHNHSFTTIEKESAQVYNDACDYGVSYNTNSLPQSVKNLIFHVNDLKDTSLIKERNEYVNGVSIKVQIAWEMDEGFERGTEYEISFNKISGPSRFNKEHNAYISVTSKSYRK